VAIIDRPESANQACRVPLISAKGRPDEKPKINTIKRRLFMLNRPCYDKRTTSNLDPIERITPYYKIR
jgi:hypothetical protein